MRPNLLPALLLAASLGHPAGCPAAPSLDAAGRAATGFATARAADGRELLLGHAPPPAAAPLPEGLSCAELYERRRALMRTQLDYRPPYSDDARNRAAFAIGTIWHPALAFLPFSAVQDYLDSDRKALAEAEIDRLRAASAMLQCYER